MRGLGLGLDVVWCGLYCVDCFSREFAYREFAYRDLHRRQLKG